MPTPCRCGETASGPSSRAGVPSSPMNSRQKLIAPTTAAPPSIATSDSNSTGRFALAQAIGRLDAPFEPEDLVEEAFDLIGMLRLLGSDFKRQGGHLELASTWGLSGGSRRRKT